jgi:type III pantothenate kinase
VSVRASKNHVMVIDIGNTSTAIGLYSGDYLKRTIRIPTGDAQGAKLMEALTSFKKNTHMDGGVVASVVPSRTEGVLRAVKRVTGQRALQVTHKTKLGAPITYPHPDRIGADRLANAAGALKKYAPPIIVVDIGTATTFDILLDGQGYAGGVIAPGPDLMLEYLSDKTALLPRIKLRPVRRPVGKSTVEAMRIGALHGYRGMLKEILSYCTKDLRGEKVTLCVTGGYARWVMEGLDIPFVYDKNLTLFGLATIYGLNR